MLQLQGAWSVLDDGVRDGAFPGASAVVATPERILGEYGTGRYTYEAEAPCVTDRTRYDLASVSKTFTAAAVMALVEASVISLDDPAAKWLPELQQEDQQAITIRLLLTHQAGIISRADWNRRYPTAESLWQAFFEAPLAFYPGLSILYSSAGYMFLGLIVERVSGRRLDKFMQERFFGPLGMTGTGYCPAPDVRPFCAPTEFSPERNRLLQGEVHDENAGIVGGICGHTGIFSTARDVAAFGRMLAGGGLWLGQRILEQETVADMLRIQRPGMWPGWGLGWMHGNPAFGSGFRGAAGHTGFTGTSILVDLQSGLTAVLLTNRVFPTRRNEKISLIRARFHDAVADALREGAC